MTTWDVVSTAEDRMSHVLSSISLPHPCLAQAFFMSIPLSLLRVAAEHWRWNDAVHLTCQGLLSQTFAVIVNEYITEINLSGVVLSSIVSFCEYSLLPPSPYPLQSMMLFFSIGEIWDLCFWLVSSAWSHNCHCHQRARCTEFCGWS